MRVLLTRPLGDARRTEALLQARGHLAVIAPLLTVNFHDGPELDLNDIQAVVATSANGVRALAARTKRRDIGVYSVGPQTAGAARQAGFPLVKNAQGNAADLARAIVGWTSPDKGALLHAAGAQVEGVLDKALGAAGFTVHVAHLYQVDAVAELPAIAREELASDTLDAALLYSPRSARTFARCVVNAGLTAAAAKLVAGCISEAAAAALSPLTMREIRLAKRPNQESLLDCLG
jgi:uroporphyrinogen-III synthase